MRGNLLLIATASVLVSSCADMLKIPTIRPKAAKSKKFSEGDSLSGMGGVGGVPGAGIKKPDEGFQAGKTPEEAGFLPAVVGKGVVIGGMELPSDADIAWAKDDPKEAWDPFGEGVQAPVKKKSVWMENYTEARRESMRSGKPILMFFTSTKNSSSSSAIKSELFAAHDFGDWAKENVVRLQVDIDGGSIERGKLEGDVVKRRGYAEKLKKQFHVLGYPTVVILQPDGSVYSQERGYRRGNKSELWGKLKNAALTIAHNHSIWKRKMVSKGYREWKGTNGRVVMAKLAHYHEGSIVLIEPDGNRVKTTTLGLSKDDRAWIIAEQEKWEAQQEAKKK